MPEPPLDFEGRTAASGNRPAAIVVLVVVAFIVIALAKPWDMIGTTAGPSPAALVPTAAAPSAEASAAEEAASTPSPSVSEFSPSSDVSTFRLGAPADGVWSRIEWQKLEPQQALSLVQKVVRWPGGFLALGLDNAGGTPLWSSTDGQVWDPVPSGTGDGFWPGLRILAATAMKDTLWAEATARVSASTTAPSTPEPMSIMPWSSRNGHAWAPVAADTMPIPLGLVGQVLLASSPNRLVLAWNELTLEGSSRAQVWWSSNGTAWHRVAVGSLPVGFEVFGLVTSPDGAFLAAGRSTRERTPSAVLLRSQSAQSWTSLALPTDQLALGLTQISVAWNVYPGAKGMLAVGAVDDLPGQELWWASVDGQKWTAIAAFWPLGLRPCPDGAQTPGGGEGCGAFPNGVVASDGHRIVALRADGVGGGWASSDGRDWQQFDAGPGPHPTSIDSVVVMPSGLLVSAGGETWYGQADEGRG